MHHGNFVVQMTLNLIFKRYAFVLWLDGWKQSNLGEANASQVQHPRIPAPKNPKFLTGGIRFDTIDTMKSNL